MRRRGDGAGGEGDREEDEEQNRDGSAHHAVIICLGLVRSQSRRPKCEKLEKQNSMGSERLAGPDLATNQQQLSPADVCAGARDAAKAEWTFRR